MSSDRHAVMERECEYCGETFFARVERVRAGQGRFCSLNHANLFARENSKKSLGKKNGRKYWDGEEWKVHWYDEDGKVHVTTYQRWWWEMNHDVTLPRDLYVVLKDGNPENISPSNFVLMSKAELSVLRGHRGAGSPKPSIAGENSKWWKGGVSRNGGYGFGFSKSLKKRIKIRDEYICQCCYFEFPSRNLQIHHIDKDITNNNLDNLVTVCTSCHRAIHGTERKINDRIRYFQSLLLE